MAAASSFDSTNSSSSSSSANNNSSNSIDVTTMADSDGISRSVSSVAVADTVPSNDTSSSQRSVGSRPTPLPSNNNSSLNNPRRHPTATSKCSPRRRKKDAVVKHGAAKSFKKQPLGKMWVRHVPIAIKPRSNYFDSRDIRRKDEQTSSLHHQNRQQQPLVGDSTDAFLSTAFLLSSPMNDHGTSTFLSHHPPANSHSFQSPQSQPKYFYRRPHDLRSSIATVHAFGESGKPLSSSLASSSSTTSSSSSPSSSPNSSPISSPTNHASGPLWTDPSYSCCYNHRNANANVNANDGGYSDNYVFPGSDAATLVKLMGC